MSIFLFQPGRAVVLLLQMAVIEREILLPSLRPRSFKVEIQINALLILVRDGLRFIRSLEPRQVLLVESPTLLLELLCGEILHVCPLAIVEDVEQGVYVEIGKERRVGEMRRWLLRVVVRCGIGIARDVVFRPERRQDESVLSHMRNRTADELLCV